MQPPALIPLTVNNASVNAYAGLLQDGGTRQLALLESGTSTLTISGINTFRTGDCRLSSGTLKLANPAALGAARHTVALNGGTLDLATDTSVNAYNVTVGGTATIVSDTATAASAGITHTLGTLSIGNYQLNVSGGSNVTSGTAGLTFGATTYTGAPTFNITNPSGGGTTFLALGNINNGVYTASFTGNGSFAQTGVWGNGVGGVTLGPGLHRNRHAKPGQHLHRPRDHRRRHGHAGKPHRAGTGRHRHRRVRRWQHGRVAP